MNRIRVLFLVAVVGAALAVTFALTYAQSVMSPVTFTLENMNDSGQSGTVTLTDAGGGKTLVEVTVEGQPAGSTQPLQIHEGKCGPTLARIVYNLNDLEDGESSTTVDMSLASLTGEGSSFAVNSHKSQKEYNIYVLCGNIPTQSQAIAFATATEVALRDMQTRPANGIAPVTFALVEENDSGQSGTVTLTDLGNGKTMVEVTVTGEPEGASQPLHVHEGHCGPTLARLAYNLNNLEDGQSSTTIDAPLETLIDAGFQFAINSHKSQKEYNIYVLCGNVPSQGQAQPTAIIAVATAEAETATAVPPTAAPATQVPPTAAPATATSAPPTAVPATNTSVPPTAVPATATSVPATATNVPATNTSVPPTAVPATATSVPATATNVPATATSIPTTAVPPTATSVPATTVPATATSVPATSVPATQPPATESAGGAVTAGATTAATEAATTPTTEATNAPTEPSATETQVSATTEASETAQATEEPSATAEAGATAEPTTAPAMPETGADMGTDNYIGLGAFGLLITGAGVGLMRLGRPLAANLKRSRTNRKAKKTARRS